MDLKFSESDIAFRQEVAHFLQTEYPEDIKEKQDKRIPLETVSYTHLTLPTKA